MDCVIVFGSIDITADGRKAIVTLSAGDMRRSLNILQVQSKAFCVWIHHPVEITWICLWRFSVSKVVWILRLFPVICLILVLLCLWSQSTSMAYGKVTEESVYTCTGHPLRSDIANILDWSLNKDFTTAYKRILH